MNNSEPIDPPPPVIRIVFLLIAEFISFISGGAISLPRSWSTVIGFKSNMLVFPLIISSREGTLYALILKLEISMS